MRAAWACVLTVLLGATAAGGEEGRIAVSYQAGRLSVTARAAPLADVLAEVSRATGVAIALETGATPATGRTLDIVFEAVSLEEGLRRLLRDTSYVLLYSSAGLAEIHVYPRRGGPAPGGSAVDASRLPSKLPAARNAARSPGSGAADPAELAGLRTAALASPDPTARATALDRLSAGSDPGLARETALGVLRRERDPAVLQSALDLLLRHDAVPLDPVFPLAEAGRASGVRMLALRLLARHGAGDPRVATLLGTLAASDRDDDVRQTAQSLLGELEKTPPPARSRRRRR